MQNHRPDFERPPVHEVVMGVQFDSLPICVAHIGRFWATVEKDYPQTLDNAPLLRQLEDFDSPGKLKPNRINLSTKPDMPRVFLEDATGEWLMQIQPNRFIHNWRMGSEASKYPRYPIVRKRFLDQWNNFLNFVAEFKLGEVSITQMELTYLNTIPLPSSEAHEVFPGTALFEDVETVEFSFSTRKKDIPKRLRAMVKPAIQNGKSVTWFQLTVRGQLSTEESPMSWFDNSRDWISETFMRSTSQKWHETWGKK